MTVVKDLEETHQLVPYLKSWSAEGGVTWLEVDIDGNSFVYVMVWPSVLGPVVRSTHLTLRYVTQNWESKWEYTFCLYYIREQIHTYNWFTSVPSLKESVIIIESLYLSHIKIKTTLLVCQDRLFFSGFQTGIGFQCG